MDKWLSSNSKPKSYWMGGFFRPQGLLVALRNDACKKHPGWTMEEVRTQCEVFSKDGDHKPDDGVIMVSGLFLDGASWAGKGDAGKLANSPPKIYFHEFPKLLVTVQLKPPGAPPELPRPADLRRADGPYVCPVYSNLRRGKQAYVTMVNLKTDESPHKWVLRGVCLICAKDN